MAHNPRAPEEGPVIGPNDDQSEGRTFLDLLDLFERHGRLLIGLPLVACVSALLLSLVLPARYTAESRFMPESSAPQLSRFAGIAAQLGMDIPGAESGASVDFYAELLESQDLLRQVALTEFRFRADSDTLAGNLIELLEIGGDTEAERIRNTVELLDELVAVTPDPVAELVTVSTSAPWPQLAVLMNAKLLELLNSFNLERRQSRATAEREFLEARVREAEALLIQVEGDLQRFLSQNRLYRNSPQLVFEHGRLERRVELRHQVYTSLSQAYEQARLDEVRNTPVITVIDEPRAPAQQTAPRVLMNAVLGFVLGVLLALTIVLVRELMEGARRRDPERYEELRRAIRGRLPAFVSRRRPRREATTSRSNDPASRHHPAPPVGVSE